MLKETVLAGFYNRIEGRVGIAYKGVLSVFDNRLKLFLYFDHGLSEIGNLLR
jgi:hypothetical protein